MTELRSLVERTEGWCSAIAPAKVNLRLDVLGRRADGFHEIATAMLALDLTDRVSARLGARPGLSLELEGPLASPDVPVDGRNLVWRAAAGALERAAADGRCPAELGVELALFKRIPSRAGLGGGSADAAAALLALEAAAGFELRDDERRELLGELGSDVAFFDATRASGYGWCFGRGERVRPLQAPQPRPWVALVVPAVESPTAAVYGALGLAPGNLATSPAEGDVLEDPLRGALDSKGAGLSNGLERAAIEAVPELGQWRTVLDHAAPGEYHLAGSGSGWFALHADEAAAHRSIERAHAAAVVAGLGTRLVTVARAAGHGAKLVGTEAE
ncbi:4-(cytidine 5'-diphospho)-2-C-methyl-D-erythritol kinase [Engelhardtia mirabilis]|uniref:4-(cytidine 5'-diphospho)-2-C-methyl-D-erythritol kinase n=1 Tax=Engelhardtia mirabilis TaxID=2528011 RepID=UPI00119F1351